MNDTQDVTIELLEEFTEAFNRKDLDKIIDSFAEYGEFFPAGGSTVSIGFRATRRCPNGASRGPFPPEIVWITPGNDSFL